MSTPPAYRRTSPRLARPHPMTAQGELLKQVQAAGLLDRCRTFYVVLTVALLVGVAISIASMLVLGDAWAQLVLAAALGVLFAQLGFVAHEAAHREIFESGRANDVFGRLIADLVVGISFSGWKAGHNRHHANPNVVAKDPSVNRGVFAFRPEDVADATGLYASYLRRQGILYFPILLLAGASLYIESFQTVFGKGRLERRRTEASLLLMRTAIYLIVVFRSMSVSVALGFIAVQMLVFGLCTASAFITNHIGMPILPKDARIDYLRKQVLTSRNIRGGWLTTALMGGLNFQIEHHLFPSMPRPHLRAASRLVRGYCESHNMPYTETGLFEAYRLVGQHMNEVGKVAGRGFSQCPTSDSLSR